MADTKRRRISQKRQFTSEADSLSLGVARQRRLRRLGSSERKPLPVVTPRPRREQEPSRSSGVRREKRLPRHTVRGDGLPPVMARGGMESMAVRPARRGQTKRRFDIPLGNLMPDAAGAEVRLPALPHVHLGARTLSGILVVLLIGCLVFIWQSPIFHITEIEAVGLQRLSVTDLSSVLGVLGDSIFSVDSAELEQSLQAIFPELK